MKNISKKYFISYQDLISIFIVKVKKIPWILAKDAFLLILLFILLDIFFGEILLYQYVFLEKNEIMTINTTAKFKEDVYQSVLREWQIRNNIFNNQSEKNYINPFQ